MSTESNVSEMQVRGHHPYSPSSLNSLHASPCYKSRSGSNAAAERGTLQHAVADSGEDNHDLTDEEAYAVARALVLLDALRSEVHAAGFVSHELGETYLPIDDVEVRDELGNVWKGTTGGYPDKVIYWFPNEHTFGCAVVDWKFGRYAVTPAEYNMQGWAYVLGVKKLLGRKLARGQVTFFSPHRQDPPTVFEFSDEMIEDRRLAIMKTVEEAKAFREGAGPQKDWLKLPREAWSKLFRTSDKTCQFCSRLGDCPAVADLAVRVATAHAPLSVPPDIHGWNDPRPLEVSEAFKVGTTVKNWAESYRKRQTERALETDEAPPGYELRSTYPRRVVDPLGFLEHLKKTLGNDVAVSFLDIPITPVEKHISSITPRGKKTEAVERFGKQLEELKLVERSVTPTISLQMK